MLSTSQQKQSILEAILQPHTASLRNIETQPTQLVQEIALGPIGDFLGNTKANPRGNEKEQAKAMTLWSGKYLAQGKGSTNDARMQITNADKLE